jgi:hypothetical protein
MSSNDKHGYPKMLFISCAPYMPKSTTGCTALLFTASLQAEESRQSRALTHALP